MGNIVEKIQKCVQWVGDIFNKVIKWFKDFMKDVNLKTERFLIKKQEEIKKCNDPKAVGQYLAGKHEAKQIQEIAESFSKDLDAEDLAAAQSILDNEKFDD